MKRKTKPNTIIVAEDEVMHLDISATDFFYLEFHNSDGDVKLVTPPSASTRRFKTLVPPGNEVHLFCDGVIQATVHKLGLDTEPHSDQKLVEVISDADLSLYDRLKTDIHQALNAYALRNGYDTIDDDDEIDLEFDDDGLIDTPYEFLEEEFLEPDPEPAPASDDPEPDPEPVSDDPEPEPELKK